MQYLEKYNVPTYSFSTKERELVNQAWENFRLMWQIRTQSMSILGDRTLQQYWDDCNKDYAVWTEPALPNDPVTQYSSTISRDRADIFIAHLTKQLMIPSVTAQNEDQEIDRTLGRVSRTLLNWAHDNDGHPSENGHQKMTRYVHKMVVEGTVHIQDDVDQFGLESKLVPNEEIFVPNFWQPDIQKQGRLVRAQINVVWDEAEAIYGSLPNWKYVRPGFADWWYYQRPQFKEQWQGVLMYDRVQILHYWQNCTQKELNQLKASGRVNKNAKRAKWYNVFINEIPMFPVDTLSPYKDGLFPISKGIFTEFSKSEYYWGNSLPNKCRQDKLWLDGWKTLLRYKAKLNLLPPLMSLNGQFVDEEIIVPGRITPVTEEIELKKIEGVADPLSAADVQLYEMAKNEIEAGSMAPQTEINPQQKASNAVIVENNAKVLMDAFALKVAFLVQARTFPILKRLFQFIPRGDLNKISVSDQKLEGGTRGTMEILFKKLPKMTKEEKILKSFEILKEEKEAGRQGNNIEKVYLDEEYVQNCNYYLKADPESVFKDKSEIETDKFNQVFSTVLLARPDLFNPKESAREFVVKNELSDELLLTEEQQQQQMATQQQGMPGQQQGAPQQSPQGFPQMPQAKPMPV
jgi:hypothetical protein